MRHHEREPTGTIILETDPVILQLLELADIHDKRTVLTIFKELKSKLDNFSRQLETE